MAKYLVKAKYSAKEGARGLLEDGGTARVQAVHQLVASLGGSVESFYYALGDVDAYTIVELPDNASAVSLSLVVGASGDATVEFVTLISPAEIDEAVKKSPNYDPPGKE